MINKSPVRSNAEYIDVSGNNKYITHVSNVYVKIIVLLNWYCHIIVRDISQQIHTGMFILVYCKIVILLIHIAHNYDYNDEELVRL